MTSGMRPIGAGAPTPKQPTARGNLRSLPSRCGPRFSSRDLALLAHGPAYHV